MANLLPSLHSSMSSASQDTTPVSLTAKKATRRWYYKEVFFQRDMLDFIIRRLCGCNDSRDGVLTELSFKVLSPQKNSPYRSFTPVTTFSSTVERFHSLESLGNLPCFIKDLGNLEKLDVGGRSSAGGSVIPERVLLRECEDAAHSRPFICDYDVDRKLRPCPCSDEKKVCEYCYERCLLPPARKVREVLEGTYSLVNEKDFFFWFSGGRGWHLWIMDRFVRLFGAGMRGHLLSVISRDSGVTFSDVDPTIQMNHLIRMPFSLHDVSGIPVLPLFSQTVRMASFRDLARWKDTEKHGEVLAGEITRWIKECKLK